MFTLTNKSYMNNDVTLQIELPFGVTIPFKTTLTSGTQIDNTLEMECYTLELCQNPSADNPDVAKFDSATLKFSGIINTSIYP